MIKTKTLEATFVALTSLLLVMAVGYAFEKDAQYVEKEESCYIDFGKPCDQVRG